MPGLDFLNPLSGVISAVSGIIDKFIPSAEDKAKAQLALAQLQSETTLKLAELDAQNYAAQANVITTEAKSESALTRNWRPVVALAFSAGCILSLVFVLFGQIHVDQKELVMAIAMEFLGITKICLGGYYFGRTVEKSGAGIVAAWRNKSGGAQ